MDIDDFIIVLKHILEKIEEAKNQYGDDQDTCCIFTLGSLHEYCRIYLYKLEEELEND
jgi:hypothetical protein